MDKRDFFYLLLAAFVIGYTPTIAQSSSSAYQRIELHIQPSIQIASMQPSSEIQFSVKKEKAHNTSEAGQEFRVRSNKNFLVKVNQVNPETGVEANTKAAPTTTHNNLQFSVSGNASANSTATQPGSNYTSLTSNPKDLIVKGRKGEQVFAVNYQMKHTNKYARGSYVVGVVYTATEP